MSELDDPPRAVITGAGIAAGAKGIMPIAVFVMPFGLAFGIAATERGIEPWLATVMSALVFAGASQFAALEMWTEPLPITPILLMVLAVNARHVLYGAAISPMVRPLPADRRWPLLALLTDTSWAFAMQARARGDNDPGLILGSGLVLWAVWTLSTAAGAGLGAGIGNPKSFGLDAVMIAFFATNLVGLWRGPSDTKPWLAALAAAGVGLVVLPAGWHVLAAALAGGLVGVLNERS